MQFSWRPILMVGLVGLGLSVTACSYTPARIDPEPVIEVGDGHGDYDHDHDYDDDHDHGHGGGFCPPGQAKKGNC